ncbi:site-specific DNA-methyltransferase [Lactobacillus laiwuensis]|uniref:site-specific DNA-methyltransferase n=1 Tax=Lactobacillus laiwuensis TaxID=2841034 RepID=UPI001CC4E0BA|nr:site-specific DNA-methyltransferase [Lactobacillus laiwuensis]
MKTDNEKYNEAVQPNTAFLNELKEKLPEFFTKDGSFDLDKFKRQLKNKNVNELSEGYQLNFIGKDYARRQAGEMPSTVIVPDEKQNQGEGKNSKNLFFTGDNLEVLRHLQTAYTNKVDVIYIDPPYNTGSDGFAYQDSFEYSDDKLKKMFGLNDDEVERLKSIQLKASHSAWLTFMYPRLVLAKRLLSNKGIIFISIDDNEQANLVEICNNIFSESNYIGCITRATGTTTGQDANKLGSSLDYVLCFSKSNKFKLGGLPLTDEDLKRFSETDSKGKYSVLQLRKTGNADRKEDRPKMFYPLIAPDNSEVYPFGPSGYLSRWRVAKKTYIQLLNEGMIVWKKNKNKNFKSGGYKSSRWVPYVKYYAEGRTKQASNLLDDFKIVPGNKKASLYLKKLFKNQVFTNPKPIELIKILVSISNISKDGLVLDFFAGSSTTADAVMQLNAEDGGHRRFIMVQLPEKTYETNEDGTPKLDKKGNYIPTKGGKGAYDAGFKSIDAISRKRIRLAAKKIKEDNELTFPKDFDGSFKHYRVVKPSKLTLENIDNFDPNNINLFTNMVEGFSSNSLNIPGNTSGEQTILTTWLAKDGYPFDAKVDEVKFDDYIAHKVEDDRLYLINEGWTSNETKKLLNQLGTHKLNVQSVVIFGYSFNIAELRELENGLKQLDSKVTLLKRY